eukprot:Nk52_evm12s227 gene=Nk52_evmTU12s227
MASHSSEDFLPLQFAPFTSSVDAAFWHSLTSRKLNIYKLSEEPQHIFGTFQTGTGDASLPARLCVGPNAFSEEDHRRAGPGSEGFGSSVPASVLHATSSTAFYAPGTLRNCNTAEAFKTMDKKEMIEMFAVQLWNDITSGAAIQNPALLNRFLLLTFADLKKYHFYYWFAFPAIAPWGDESEGIRGTVPVPLGEFMTAKEISSLGNAVQVLRGQCVANGEYMDPCFLVRRQHEEVRIGRIQVWEEFFEDCGPNEDLIVAFADPCGLSGNPGWPLRNLVMLLRYGKLLGGGTEKISAKHVTIICYREKFADGKFSTDHSIVLKVDMGSLAAAEHEGAYRDGGEGEAKPKAVGWEKNIKQKMGPRMMDLSATMNPHKLAETSVDLNLKLMRWRLLPALDLEKISDTKCLLLGAGTLGCHVGRCLLGWGVRHITFVDNGTVSYSNPVRQSLFEFDDCMGGEGGGGKAKAVAAAESLKRIFPGVTSEGHSIAIPMPGHSVNGKEPLRITRETVNKLDQLIEDHDAIFLLMDTRESRWLPTLLSKSKGKLTFNCALGFDTYLVMRHGINPKNSPMSAGGGDKSLSSASNLVDLGCYFCNDVIAPTDSTKDRTLDQQCTVSRPGLSFIASALVVELFISVVHHPLGALAPADAGGMSVSSSSADKPLGLLPHQIRGFLSQFSSVMPIGHQYSKCTACSDTVLNAYRAEGFEFLLKVFNSPSYLEDLTGLTELHKQTELDAANWDVDESSDEENCI